MAQAAPTLNRDLVVQAVHAYDAGDPALLRELNDQLSTEAMRGAYAIMAVAQNEMPERSTFIANALYHQLISEDEMLELALAPHRVDG